MIGTICTINGTVIDISDSGLEPPDRNWLLTVFALILIVYLSFFLMIWWIITHHAPGRGLLLGSLFFRRGPSLIPVKYYRIRTSPSTEQIVRVKGFLDSNVVSGDSIEVSGRLNDSTLYFSSGRNLTTGAPLNVRKK